MGELHDVFAKVGLDDFEPSSLERSVEMRLFRHHRLRLGNPPYAVLARDVDDEPIGVGSGLGPVHDGAVADRACFEPLAGSRRGRAGCRAWLCARGREWTPRPGARQTPGSPRLAAVRLMWPSAALASPRPRAPRGHEARTSGSLGTPRRSAPRDAAREWRTPRRCRPPPRCSRQPRSQAHEAVRAGREDVRRSSARAFAPRCPACLTAKGPPKPQHSSAAANSTTLDAANGRQDGLWLGIHAEAAQQVAGRVIRDRGFSRPARPGDSRGARRRTR